MKRIFKYLGAVLAGTLVLSSCVEEPLVVYNPEAGEAQTLGAIQGCTLDADGDAITTTYTEVDFGLTVPVVYTLNIAASGAEEINTKFNATIADGTISFSQKDLNSAILNMGGVADVEFGVDFQLVASLANDKGAAIAGDSTYVKYSNVVTAKFVPYSTTVLDVDKYDHVWIIGAAESIGAWAHDKVFQYLYNYNGDGETYTGMIYYTDGAAGGWKLTGIAGWDDSCNWGSVDQAEEAEAASVTLISSGGSKDIKCYSKPYYMWTFNKTTLELKKEFGFTTMAIVGSFNDWNAADENCVMTYNPYLHRFYIDYDFAADGELKFTADGAWDLNFGVGMEQGAGNIAVTAGKYRVYLDFNKNEYSFDANMYGKEEPGAGTSTPEPEQPEPDQPVVENIGWGIVGTINNWGGDGPDVDMKVGTGWLVATGVEIPENAEVKFRLDGGWDANFGGTFAADAEIALVANGDNFKPAAGTYDIYLNPDVPAAYFMTAGAAAPAAPQTWGIVGTTNNWGGDDLDMAMTLDETQGLWVRKGVALPDGGEIKFRFAHDWGVNFGGAFAVDTEIALASGGDNLKTVAGTYDIYLDAENAKAYIMTEGSVPDMTPAVDPWETAAAFANGAEATDDALMKEIRAYADADNLYVRVTAVAALEGANYLDVDFCDGNGTETVWWGWTTTGTNFCWNEHQGEVDAEGNLVSMLFGDAEIEVKTEKTADSIVWYLTYPRESIAKYVASGKTYVSALLWNNWGPYFAVPARYNAMLEVTLP